MDEAVAGQLDEVLDAFTSAHSTDQPPHEKIDPTTASGAMRYLQWLEDLKELETLAQYVSNESARLTLVIDQLPAESPDQKEIYILNR